MSHIYIAIHCVFDKILVLSQHLMLSKICLSYQLCKLCKLAHLHIQKFGNAQFYDKALYVGHSINNIYF